MAEKAKKTTAVELNEENVKEQVKNGTLLKDANVQTRRRRTSVRSARQLT